MKTKLIPVGSSSIKSLEYDTEEKTLLVEFTAGSKYIYSGVDEGTATALYIAESKGKYLAANIKNKFDVEKISEPLPHGADVPAAWPFPTSKKP